MGATTSCDEVRQGHAGVPSTVVLRDAPGESCAHETTAVRADEVVVREELVEPRVLVASEDVGDDERLLCRILVGEDADGLSERKPIDTKVSSAR